MKGRKSCKAQKFPSGAANRAAPESESVMEIPSAIHLVNSLIFMPGWKFTAEDHRNRFEGAIRVRIDYPALNSDRSEAANGYPTPITTYAAFPVIVADCDDTCLYRKIMDAIICIQTHEAREFLRVSGTYWAPFHPHRIDGIRRWGNEITDLQFGIA